MKYLLLLILFFYNINAFADVYSNNKLSKMTLGTIPAGIVTGVSPMGDSITAGTVGAGSANLFGYRQQLQLLLGIKNYAFVGPFSSPTSNGTFSVTHCGVAGNTTTQILARESDCFTALNSYTPKIAILLAGLNDISGSVPQATITANLGTIIDTIVTNDSATDIYVMLLTPDSSFTATIIAQNTDYVSMLQGKQGSNSHIHIVDIYTAFTVNALWATQLMANVGHPNEKGYGIMAQALYNCIKNHSSTYCDGH